MKKFYSILLLSCMAFGAASAAPLHKSAKRSALLSPATVLEASDITADGFTANWKAYPGAETYTVMVYEPCDIAADGRYVILSESFDLVNKGTFAEPVYDENLYSNLSDDFDWTYTPDWSALYGIYARGMVSGVVFSPYIDLTADGGRYTVEFSVVGYGGATVKLAANGTTVDEREFILTETGENKFSVTFENGAHDTYFTYTDYGILDDPDGLYLANIDFLDNFEVIQNFKAGETALRPVAVREVETTSTTFATLPYAYGAKHLAYDIQANVVTFNDPDDPYDYDVERSDFSPLQHVYLLGYDGIAGIEAESDGTPEFYDLRGVRVDADALAPGLYIRRQNGKTAKVLVK